MACIVSFSGYNDHRQAFLSIMIDKKRELLRIMIDTLKRGRV